MLQTAFQPAVKTNQFRPVAATTAQEMVAFCTPAHLPHLSPNSVAGQNADAHWMLLDASEQVVARCSLWWRNSPPYPGHRPGLIGHYAARTAPAAAQLLHLAGRQLAQQGCTLAIGPIDGNTWQRYRLVVERGSEPPFLLEPNNPAAWPAHFTGNGFTVLAHYYSAITTDLGRPNPRLAGVARRAANRGITIRPLKPDHFDTELSKIYQIALASFSQNLLYTPISQSNFMALYRPIRPYVQPELILIAEQGDRPIGFLFALPNLLQAQQNQPVDTVIIKTVAVHPNYQTAGLGSLLVDRCQQVAHSLGYSRAIHALMHGSNDSRKISRRNHSQTIRKYALFAKELTADEYC